MDFDTQSVLSSLNIEYAVNIEANSSDIVISNTLPDSYKITKGYNIGFTYWETNKLPDSWVKQMNKMDEIWTTSEWAKNVFINSGVTVPVFSFKLGIDDSLYFPQRRFSSGQIKFMSIGSPSTRKNSQIAVDAFLKVLGGDDRFHLVYKTIGPPDARIDNKKATVRSLYGYEGITVVDEDLTAMGLADLYDQIDCLIYPTSGEGWGWLPQQGIAKAIPTICTSGTACEEYSHLSIPLDYEWSDEGLFGLYIGNGPWMKPNFDDLCDKLYDVSQNYDKYAELTFTNVSSVYETMKWDYVIKDYNNRLCQI